MDGGLVEKGGFAGGGEAEEDGVAEDEDVARRDWKCSGLERSLSLSKPPNGSLSSPCAGSRSLSSESFPPSFGVSPSLA